MGLLFTTFYVGVDVGRYAVEGVKVKKKGKAVEIVKSVLVPYENKAFEGDSIADEGEIALALGKVKNALEIDIEDYIVSAIFPDRILFRKLELPTMPRDQALNAAKFQIVKELSISPEEITVEIEANQKALSSMEISSFIVKNEDISRFNNLFFKANVPFPDVLDAGYFKFLYLLRDNFFDGVSVVVFEDISATYVELFQKKRLIGIDNIMGGTEGTEYLDEEELASHYEELSDKVQNLVKMMLSRYSMAEVNVKNAVLVSEIRQHLTMWKKVMENFEIAEDVKSYDEAAIVKKPLIAYSLALRGVNENSKHKFLQKKDSKGKTA